MKKVFSMFLSFILLLFTFSPCFGALAAGLEYKIYEKKTEEIKAFSNVLSDLIDEYDISSEGTAAKYRMKSDDMQALKTSGDISDFQTARLIVYTDDTLNDCNAAVHLSGYEDMHILQYETPEQAIEAYECYSNDKRIDSVEPDVILTLDEDTQTSPNSDYDYGDTPEEGVKHSWGYDYIQTPDAFQYVLQHTAMQELPEIVVAVIDDGIGKGDEEFNKRLLKAYTFLGSDADPYIPTGTHGTRAAAVIYENTLPNVKFVSYQTFKNGKSTSSLTSLAEQQAALDKVDIINSSYGGLISETPPVKSGTAAERIDNSKPLHIASAGNHKTSKPQLPSCKLGVISVANLANNEALAASSARGSSYVDVAAPGEGTFVSYKKGEYVHFGGTSCAAPFVVAISAMLMSYYPETSNAELTQILFDSCNSELKTVRYGIVNMFKALTYYADDAYQTKAPNFGIESSPVSQKYYDEIQHLDLTCADENAEIYYTLNKSIPSKDNGVLYTKPIELSKTSTVYAVAYSKNGAKSEIAKRTFYIRISQTSDPDENGWLIRKNGMIYGYVGSESDLVVPETVFGIKVKGIEAKAFEGQSWLSSIIIPESISTIGERSFSNCDNLTEITATSVTTVPKYAFSNCYCLDKVNMPKLEKVNSYAFYHTGALDGLPFENLTNISSNSFTGTNVVYLHLDSAESIGTGAFSSCNQLVEVYLPKITSENCATYVFQNCRSIEKVLLGSEFDCLPGYMFWGSGLVKADFFPNILYSDPEAFGCCNSLAYVYMPSLLETGEMMFGHSENLQTVIFPKVKNIFTGTFWGCKNLTTVEFSDDLTNLDSNIFKDCDSLKYVKLYGDFDTYTNTFEGSSLERIEMNRVQVLEDLPDTQGCIIAMPSTFKDCTENTEGRNYKIYGTKGTYAEQWANENGHEFIEISQETAILQDVPMEYADETRILSPDVIGFNRTYQWYANDKADNTTGTVIEGATNREFSPADYPAKYYYCVVTSTDVGYDPIEIRTGVTENKTLKSADYSAYDAAVLKANALEREYYKDLTALDAALAVDVSGLTALEQGIVDAQTKAIEEALTALEFKDADYSAYNAAVEKANALDKSLYADTAELDKVLAEDISGLTILNQDIVDEQTKAIEDALKNLAFKPADYTEVEKAKSEIPEDLSVYTDASISALQEVLNSVDYSLNIMEQTTVDGYAEAITEAVNALQYKPADYTEYNKAVEQAQVIDRSLYKDLSALDKAVAVDVSGKNIMEQEIVDKQTQAILNAISALVYKVADYTDVEKAIASIPEDLSVYTDESVSVLQEALNTVDYSLNITKQETVDGYAKTIIDAVNGLELKPVTPPVTDPTETNEPTQPETPDTPSTPSDTSNPAIPNTASDKLVCVGTVGLLPFTICVLALVYRKRKYIK